MQNAVHECQAIRFYKLLDIRRWQHKNRPLDRGIIRTDLRHP